MRQRAWTVLTGVDVIMAERVGDYENLVKKAEEDSGVVLETIERDIHRTFPRHYLFHNGLDEDERALRRVLRAYSVYDSEVGYCQGMNFIAAMFLTFLSEEEAFWLLVVVMNEEPYKLRELFGEDMAGTHEVLYIAEKLMHQFLPKLSQHMEAESIHISMFVTQWLLTVYTSTFPFELVSRVWDSFMVEGWKVVYRVMLALLEEASKDLMGLHFEQILNFFRDFPQTVDGQTVMARSLKIS
ncbi:RabGAP, partial [Thalassiosira pseudonana CCMP1335]